MKHFLFYLFILFFSTYLYAQDEDKSKTSHNKEDKIILDFAYNMILSQHENINPSWRSSSYNINFLKDIPIGKGNFGLGLGVVFSYSNYANNLNIKTDSENGLGIYSVLSDPISYKSNKMKTLFLDIPLEIRLRTNKNNDGNYFRFYIGGKVGYLIRSFSQLDNNYSKQRFYNIPELNKLRYGITVRLGFSNWNIFAYYQLSSLFDKNKLTEATVDSQLINNSTQEIELGTRPISTGMSFSF